MSEHHILGISITLAHVDKALCEFDQWAHGHVVRSVLYEIRNKLSESQREAIAAEVAQMKALLQEVKRTLRLPGSVRFAEKMIIGSCSVLWTSLVDLEGCRLRRYGEVPPDLAMYLDPKVADLIRRLRNIADVVARGGPS